MGISDRYTYYWTIFSGLPFGVVCFIMGIYLFFSIPPVVDDLNVYNGKIKDYGIKEVYHEKADTRNKTFFLSLRHNYEFYSVFGKHKEILVDYFQGKNLINHSATIWIEKDEAYIEQLFVDDELVLKYNPPYWNAWIFLIMGILVTTGAIFYLKNNADDIKAERGLLSRILFGKKKRK